MPPLSPLYAIGTGGRRYPFFAVFHFGANPSCFCFDAPMPRYRNMSIGPNHPENRALPRSEACAYLKKIAHRNSTAAFGLNPRTGMDRIVLETILLWADCIKRYRFRHCGAKNGTSVLFTSAYCSSTNGGCAMLVPKGAQLGTVKHRVSHATDCERNCIQSGVAA